MKDLGIFLFLTILGYFVGTVAGVNPLEHELFPLFATTALVFGLYVSVAGIDLGALGRYKKTALFIVTAGVPIQIFLTAGLMWVIWPNPAAILVAVAIDQIDPLSVSTLLSGKIGMSKEAKALLRVWASFDDPVTVLVGFAFFIPLITQSSGGSIVTYLLSMAINLFPVLVLFGLFKLGVLKNKLVGIVVLILAVVFAIYFQAFLFAALVGLFIRPFNADKLSQYTTYLYYLVIIVVGAAIAHYGIDLRLGFLLAVVEFFVIQPLSAIFIVKGTTNDIFRLAFAQQNGLTTILMGLAFQAMGFDVIQILLPAIIIINSFNLLINGYYSWREKHGMIITKADQEHLEKFNY